MRPAGGIFRRLHHPFRAEMADADDEEACHDAGLRPGPLGPFGETAYIGIGADADSITLVGRDDQFAVDGAGFGNLDKVGFGKQRIVFLRAEEIGRRVVA